MLKKLSIVLIVPALLILAVKFFVQDKIHIAFIGPLSGPSAKSGQELLNGMNVYVDYINANGGIKNRKVIVDTYDDKGDVKIAKEQAEKIAKDGKAVGVVGHTSSDCAQAAGSTYDLMQIPVLLPCATNVTLTQKHKSFFRVIFNDQAQSDYMMLFAKHILHAKQVVIVFSDTLFGNGLQMYLNKYAKEYNLPLVKTIKIVNKQADYSSLSNLEPDTVIMVATATNDANGAIEQIRKHTNAAIIGPDAVAALFSEGITSFPYKHVYTTTPLLFEMCGDAGDIFKQQYQKMYNKTPSWFGVYGHDSAKILLDAVEKNMNHSELSQIRMGIIRTFNNPETITEEKENDQENDIKYDTISQRVRFTNQESNRNIQFGVLKNTEVIANTVQCNLIKDNSQVADFEQLKAQALVIQDHTGRAFYKTHIVASGVNINEISVLNIEKGTYMLDFYLWIRYDNAAEKADDIVFLNSIENIVLPKVIETEPEQGDSEKKESNVTFAKLIAHKVENEQIYKIYRVKNVFRLDSFRHLRAPFFDVFHTLGVNFRNTLLDNNFIRYAKDATVGNINLENLHSTTAMLEKTGWKSTSLTNYEDAMVLNSMGNPHYLDNVEDVVFSRFNSKMVINDTMFSFFDFLTFDLAKVLLISALLFLLLLEWFKMSYPEKKGKISMIEILPYVTFLLSAQYITLDYVTHNDFWYDKRKMINLAFDIIWWLIFAGGVNLILQGFVWKNLERRTGKPVPSLLYWCVSLIVYIFATFGIIAFVLDMPITSLLASTSLLMFLVVMAIQMNVSNIFSGIFLNVEGAFREGDWVSVEEVEGWIVKTGWRTTSIQTERKNIVHIPNSKMAEAMISNYNYPCNDYDLKLQVSVSLYYQPDFILQLLKQAVAEDKDIKEIDVILKYYEGEKAVYELTLTLNDYSDPVDDRTRNNMYTNIWNFLHKAGIEAAMRPSSRMFVSNINTDIEINTQELIQNCALFANADKKQLNMLIKKAQVITLEANSIVNVSDQILIIGHGVVLQKPFKKQAFSHLNVGQVLGLQTAENLPEAEYETLTTVMFVKLDPAIVLMIINSLKISE